MTDEYQIDNVTWAEKDSDGNIVVDSDVVNTDKVATTAVKWQDKSSSRSFDTWYSSPSDEDIVVMIQFDIAADNTNVSIAIDINDTQIENAIIETGDLYSSNEKGTVPTFIVPAGQFYQVRQFGDTASYSIRNWTVLST